MNTPNNSIMYSQPHAHLSQMRSFSPEVQWSQPQQLNYNIHVGRSNMGQPYHPTSVASCQVGQQIIAI